MEPTVGRQPPTENEFDISLNLSPSTAVPSLPETTEHRGSYQQPPKDVGVARQQKKGKGRDNAEGNVITGAGSANPPNASAKGEATPKPKRVRTGCLTCRERHLKCDETLPRCQNCQKSDRMCKRGVRLNFIDTQVAAPPYAVPPRDWRVDFRDESREIAAEYLGGPERYPSVKREAITATTLSPYVFSDSIRLHPAAHRGLPGTPSLLPPFSTPTHSDVPEPVFQTPPQPPAPEATFSSDQSMELNSSSKQALMPPSNPRPYLNNPEEVLLMQVFVEEVGLWMDSMDAMKHFTHILPFHALGEPMLLNAFLACGARHLFLVNPSYGEEKALYYYNTSSRDLLTYLQNPNRDSFLSATTAVVLNVYEIMCEKAMQRMNHIAGARALIRECRWDAKSVGIGAACFWLNIGMELLSCLHFNWKMAWDPDTWGIDMNITPSNTISGNEEFWTHRIVYICAKITNFRASAPQYHGVDRNAHHISLVQRCEEWNRLKAWCDEWARCIPRSMQPLGYLQSWQTNSKSSFPEVWLVKRPTVVARLFYHTACCVLAKIHPTESAFSEQMIAMQQTHAHDICGIVAHVKDRGVASVSIRCLAIAAECLVSRVSQEEVLGIMDKIIKETGWQVGFVQQELIERWGWNTPSSQIQEHQRQQQQRQQPPTPTITTSTSGAPPDLASSLLNSTEPATPSRSRIPQGIVNPMMATADFSYENHPYQNHYVAPQNNQLNNYQYGPY